MFQGVSDGFKDVPGELQGGIQGHFTAAQIVSVSLRGFKYVSGWIAGCFKWALESTNIRVFFFCFSIDFD